MAGEVDLYTSFEEERDIYYHGYIKTKFRNVNEQDFIEMVHTRLVYPFQDYLLPHKEYRHNMELREVFSTQKKRNFYHIRKWFKENDISKICIDHSELYHTNDQMMEMTTKCVEEVLVPYQKKKIFIEPIIENVEIKNEIIPECLLKKKRGRPVGSKNQTQIFMPIHKIFTIKDKIDDGSLVLAIADLVWRNPNKSNLYYLDFIDNSNLTDQQLKYIKALFYENENRKNIANNPYFQITKSGSHILLLPKRKRAGYYCYNVKKNLYELTPLTKIANYLNISNKTCQRRLDKMSVSDAVKDLK
jgi:hypothetical protein